MNFEYIGYRLKGTKGMFVSVVAFLLPGTIAMLMLSAVYFSSPTADFLKLIFRFLAPIIVSILLWATYNICRWYIKNFRDLIITGLALSLSFIKISPVVIILTSGILGMLMAQKLVRKLNMYPIGFFLWTIPLVNEYVKLITLGTIFFYVGSISFGGGYAAIPFIIKETSILRNWISNDELVAGIAFSQITPGPVALLATFIGYKVMGIFGALVATISIFLPSTIFLYLILIAKKYFINKKFESLRVYIKHFINGVKPAIASYMIYTTISLALKSNLHQTKLWSLNFFLILVGFLLIYRLKVNPIWLILGGIVMGIILTVFKV
ncbi:MAG: chromate transporter [candidate division WOR-3 bacterium]|nr:chromate transporter [candidate division WOR-3 bacterium]